MEYVLLGLAVLLGAGKNIITKVVKKKSVDFYGTMKINVITFACAFAVVFLIGIKSVGTLFSVPWLMAVLYAVCTLGSQISLMKAVELGSVSVSSLFYSCGFIFPTLFGSIYYNESINVFHISGILLIIVSFVFSVKREGGKRFNLAWLIAALGGLCFSGAVGILQKVFTSDYTQFKLDNFLCVAFFIIIVVSAILMLMSKPKKEQNASEFDAQTSETETHAWDNKAVIVIFTVALGIVMGLINKTNTYLSGVLSSVIVFPVINGGVIISSTVLSGIVFKERLFLMQKIGLVIGIIGIIVITVGKSLA